MPNMKHDQSLTLYIIRFKVIKDKADNRDRQTDRQIKCNMPR